MIDLFEHFPKIDEEDAQNDYVYRDWLDSPDPPKKKCDRGLALVDLDGTIREPVSDNKFINTPEDQRLILFVNQTLRRLNEEGYSIYGVSNQGGVKAGHKTRQDTVREMRITLSLCPYINRIYYAIYDHEVWCVTRTLPFLDPLPIWLNTFSRYRITTGDMGEDPKYLLGGYRKSNPGMLRMAIADWCNKYKLLDHLIEPRIWIKEFYTYFDAYDVVTNEHFFSKYLPGKHIFMTGDRDEDRVAALKAKVSFVDDKNFRKGLIPDK